MSLFAGDAAGAVYAGFWRRALAYLLDQLVLFAGLAAILFFIGLAYGVSIAFLGSKDMNDYQSGLVFIVITYALMIPMFWLYYALMESSLRQATLGKMVLGLRVTDLDGGRISFGRATGRHFAKILSGLFFGAGYVMAGFTQRKQALHDQLASCLVIRQL